MRDAGIRILDTHPYDRPWQKSSKAVSPERLSAAGLSWDDSMCIHYHIQQKQFVLLACCHPTYRIRLSAGLLVLKTFVFAI